MKTSTDQLMQDLWNAYNTDVQDFELFFQWPPNKPQGP